MGAERKERAPQKRERTVGSARPPPSPSLSSIHTTLLVHQVDEADPRGGGACKREDALGQRVVRGAEPPLSGGGRGGREAGAVQRRFVSDGRLTPAPPGPPPFPSSPSPLPLPSLSSLSPLSLLSLPSLSFLSPLSLPSLSALFSLSSLFPLPLSLLSLSSLSPLSALSRSALPFPLSSLSLPESFSTRQARRNGHEGERWELVPIVDLKKLR